LIPRRSGIQEENVNDAQWAQLKYFKKDEFTCHCGCGSNEMKLSFMLTLDSLRDFVGIPFIVTSGYRCPTHNASVSHTGKTGPHTTGQAADIQISGHAAYELLVNIHRVGITGIGLNQKGTHSERYIHLDTLPLADGQPRPWVWTY
jgi:zinc D-Ala-D-Ala carboxypeptidase